MSESPWTKKDIRANLMVIFILVILAIIMIIIKSWIMLVFYWVFWLLYITVGRYVSCRHCDFLGKPCPSWGMGIIGAKFFKRSEKKNFLEGGGLWKMMLFDISFLALSNLMPIYLYLYLLFVEGLTIIDWGLLILYSIMVIITLGLHQKTGCNKCPTDACPLSGLRKKK
jgi:hypothetical protein